MSLVRYYAAATLDGYIAGPDDSLDWLTSYQGSFEGADSAPSPTSGSSRTAAPGPTWGNPHGC